MNEKRWRLGIEGLEDNLPDEVAIELISLDVLKPLPREEVNIDPVKYEIAVHRINAILREGSFALARTSGSPIVTECGEYMFAIYDAEGHASYVTAGVLPHLTGTEGAIKLIRYWYEDDPGIEPGDQFLINDPYVVGIHTPDMLVAKPIFYNDELIAWVASLTHTVELGAMEPGGVAHSTDIYQEGIRIPGSKIVSQGKASKTLFKQLERSVRDPQLMALDTVAKIAGNNVAAARLDEFIKKEGPEFVKALLRRMIYDGEDKARERLMQVPDGRWHSRVYSDHDGLCPNLIWADVVCEKKGDALFLDLSGSSPQNPGPINSSLPGTIGCIFSSFVTTMLWDLPWNRGIIAPVEINVPKGTMYNPNYPTPCSACPPTAGALLAGAAVKVVSKMNMAAGFTSEVCAPWMSNWNGVFMGGLDQYGNSQGTITMDANGGGTGATPYQDGDDTAAFILAPGALMADVESYEAKNPLLYVFRRQRTDSCGHGMFRGGLGGEAAVMVHNTSKYAVGFRGFGKYIAPTHGLFGGYPADSIRSALVMQPDLKDKLTQEYSDIIESFDRLKETGELRDCNPIEPPTPMKDGDIYYLRWSGGGGYGDPIKRDPELVRNDLLERAISFHSAKAIYGVVVDEQTYEIDWVSTKKIRAEVLAERKARWQVAR